MKEDLTSGFIIWCAIFQAMQIGMSVYALSMLYQTSEKVNGIKTDMEFLKLDEEK